MQNETHDFIDRLTVGRKQSYRNMELYPLLSDYAVTFDYLILDEALAQKVVDIVEIDKGGSVPELKVVNNATLKILILDGEELVGAKQNRIVNTTILVREKSSVVIPVSCVEQGRWSNVSSGFSSEERVMPSFMRARKAERVHQSVRESGQYRSDQSEIWNDINEKAQRMDADSPTMEMRSIYTKSRPQVDEYLSSFPLVDQQIGSLVAINGKIVGMDCLGKAQTFSQVSRKLVESYVLDAVDWFNDGELTEISKHDVENFLQQIQSAAFEKNKGVDLGMDYRIADPRLTGFSFLHENQILHMSFFLKNLESGQTSPKTRMQRYSARRQHRNEYF